MINPNTLGMGPETREDVRTYGPRPGYSGFRLEDSGSTFGHPIDIPDTTGLGPETLYFRLKEALMVCFHKLVLSCSSNPAHANALPFLSSPSHLSKTRVRVFPFFLNIMDKSLRMNLLDD